VGVGDLNTPHHQQIGPQSIKINKKILELKHTIDQMDLADVYRHPTSAYVYSSQQPMELSPILPYLRAQSKQASAKIRK
jgi:hypothetical protein